MKTHPIHSPITAKRAAGQKAAELIQDGMCIGLGTGSTASCFIASLIERCNKGLKIKAVATSEQSFQQAKDGGVEFLDIDQITHLDVTVDGADEIDKQKRMIKGGGGALLREKIIASISKEMIVIIDESKWVPMLGKFPLPVEIAPFALNATIHTLNQKGFEGTLRIKNNAPYLTDNGHYIVDIVFKNLIHDPEYFEAILKQIPGVLETGFFFNLAGRVIIGHNNGDVQIIS